MRPRRCSFSAAISLAPSASPECSPATMNRRRSCPSAENLHARSCAARPARHAHPAYGSPHVTRNRPCASASRAAPLVGCRAPCRARSPPRRQALRCRLASKRLDAPLPCIRLDAAHQHADAMPAPHAPLPQRADPLAACALTPSAASIGQDVGARHHHRRLPCRRAPGHARRPAPSRCRRHRGGSAARARSPRPVRGGARPAPQAARPLGRPCMATVRPRRRMRAALGLVEDQHGTCLDRDAGETGRHRRRDGARADSRHVDAQLLAGLGALGQHAVARRRPLRPGSAATRCSMASVPSAPSMASTLPCATTTAWPASSGPSARRTAKPSPASARSCSTAPCCRWRRRRPADRAPPRARRARRRPFCSKKRTTRVSTESSPPASRPDDAAAGW